MNHDQLLSLFGLAQLFFSANFVCFDMGFLFYIHNSWTLFHSFEKRLVFNKPFTLSEIGLTLPSIHCIVVVDLLLLDYSFLSY